jgi:hypothetical protein
MDGGWARRKAATYTIYELVTSSVSVAFWLTPTATHSTQLNYWTSEFSSDWNTTTDSIGVLVCLSLILRPTVSRLVCLGIKHPSGAYDQAFITVRQLRACWCGTLSFTITPCPLQDNHFRVRVPWDSWPYFTFSELRHLITSSPTTRKVRVEVFEPASTRESESINYVSSLYNFGANRIQITTANGSSTIPCLSFAAKMCVNSVAKLWFLQVCPLPRKRA